MSQMLVKVRNQNLVSFPSRYSYAKTNSIIMKIETEIYIYAFHFHMTDHIRCI